jgi:hypothetical protein
MKRNSTHSLGAFHPAIFMLLVYAISLTMSIFVCRMIFYSVNGDESAFKNKISLKLDHATALK